ncbi:MAG: hypothetical protein HUK21_02865 [Fibrobacteraceae bacterium]|nr:hypothetical protein [Fibrobacteraceae bacterium]
MAKERDLEDLEDEEMDDASLDNFDEEDGFSLGEGDDQEAPIVRDYSTRRILIWEEDEVRRNACLEVLSDLMVGATFKAVATEDEALAQLDEDDWDTFVVDFYTEGVSSSDFIKRVNNYPGSILVALSMGPLTLPDEREPAKTELLRRLFDMEKSNSQIRA